MDFTLTEEQRSIRETIRKFVAKECERETVKRLDEEATFPGELFRKVADIGLCALTIPEADGGAGPDMLAAVLVTAELAAIHPPLAGVFATQSLCGGRVISELGTEAQKERYLPGLLDGSLLMTLAVTEPDQGYEETGSGTKTRAEGDRIFIEGRKSVVRLADRAAFLITHATAAEDGGASAFYIVDAAGSGVDVHPMEQVGFHGMSLCGVTFNNVSVSTGDRLGGEADAGAENQKRDRIMAAEHLAVAACAMGIARGAYDYALQYAKERIQFGKPIVRFGAVQDMLVDMGLGIRSAGLLTHRAATLADQGHSNLAECIHARLAATETARTAGLLGVQIFGGYGYAMEYDAQRYLRDALVLLTGGLTRQVLSNRLAVLWGY